MERGRGGGGEMVAEQALVFFALLCTYSLVIVIRIVVPMHMTEFL